MKVCDNLRREVKELKCFQGITYKEIAELLEIKQGSFLNFMRGSYELGEERQKRLREIINDLKE